jgi:antitoxin component YwqK of YwqJK toxin-antitoxin module
MKKLILVLCLIVLSAAAFAQEKEYRRNVDALWDNTTETMRDVDGKPIIGIVRDFYDSGKIKWEALYIDGKQDGISKIYRENGILLLEAHRKNGKLEGLLTTYSENGKPIMETSYKDNLANGLAKFYHTDGDVTEVQYKNGIAESGFRVSASERVPLSDEELTSLSSKERTGNE